LWYRNTNPKAKNPAICISGKIKGKKKKRNGAPEQDGMGKG